MLQIVSRIAWESWLVLGQMAPYLLFGFLMAGVLSVCIAPELVERHLGGSGYGPVVKAALFGIPLVVCSCGVIPVVASVRRHGASRAASASFLLSTPQTGVDSIAITYALLGTVVAVVRPILALVTGLLGGLLIWWFGEAESAASGHGADADRCHEACCVGKGKQSVWRRALVFGFVVLPRDIGFALLVGVLIAGMMGALVPHDAWHRYLGGGVFSIMAMMALGIPLYVCASASVPIAAGLIHMGASPGAALAFLISGPASNAATIAMVWRLLGRRATFLYLVTVFISAVGGGLILDWFMPTIPAALPSAAAHVHDTMGQPLMGVGAFSALSAMALALVVACAYAVGRQDDASQQASGDESSAKHAGPLERRDLIVKGMTCGHCATAVSRALQECPGVASAQVDLPTGRAIVSGRDLDTSQLLDAVSQSGYTAEIA